MTNTKGFLNRNQLKYLVIAAMLIDHIAWAFVPTASLLGQVMHVIGRLTGPTMAYMLAEGYHYTPPPPSPNPKVAASLRQSA